MNPIPCTETRTRPTVTWRLADYHLGRDLIITLLNGQHCWMLDEPNAQPSKAYPDYPRCLAAARHALRLPIIGSGATHVKPEPRASAAAA
jgi:hypothetical protein